MLQKWVFKPSPKYDYEDEKKIATRVVEKCLNRLLQGGMKELYRTMINSLLQVKSVDIKIFRLSKLVHTLSLHYAPILVNIFLSLHIICIYNLYLYSILYCYTILCVYSNHFSFVLNRELGIALAFPSEIITIIMNVLRKSYGKIIKWFPLCGKSEFI